MTRRTPQTRKRNRRKSPSPPALSPEPSNANTQPPSDDVMIDNQTSITQADHPDTSQHSTTGHRELTDQEELRKSPNLKSFMLAINHQADPFKS
ncbi:hypothetical protein H4Q26_012583 [Puccinia striiformis f. sp. tritici PST-130]|nr:hypothetical protein H4Q26_012583 [Puccinia striiformis f. sp. tritici PST-130]